MISEPVDNLRIYDDELLAPTLDELYTILSEVVEEIHDTSHCLSMRSLSFGGGDHLLNCLTVYHEASRGLLSIVTDILRDEPRALLVGSEFAIDNMLGERADPLKWRLGGLRPSFFPINP